MNLTKIAFDLISQLGYGGLAFGLFLDSFGIPIPSEVLTPLATALIPEGNFSLIGVFFVSTVAQTLGGLAGYAIGRYAGEPFLERYGKYVLISHEDLQRTRKAFEKYGNVLTMFGRCVPVVRGLIAYPAGIAEMPIRTFTLFTAIGSAVWTTILMGLGYIVGRNLELIDKYGHPISIAVIGLLVLGVLIHVRGPIMRKLSRASR